DAVRNGGNGEAPFAGDVSEGEIVLIAEGDIHARPARDALARLKGRFTRKLLFGAGPAQFLRHVHISAIAFMAVADEDVFPAVEIDVEKEGRPGPLRGRETGQLRDFSVSAIAAIEKKGVHAELRPVVNDAGRSHDCVSIGQL